jgi:hypothetical protein
MQRLLGLPTGLLRHTARLLLMALSVTTLGPAVHGVHDVDCEPLVVVHDESQHQLAAAPSDSDPLAAGEHCLACHFHRTSRGPISWEPSGLHALSSGDRLFHSDGQLVAMHSASPQPARAPPSIA